ncbi:HAD superfamily hydrolase (TIGR01549 family) [Catenuloplanes nepalensis]|uniref:HAD superfamily hydrolase (TIGR01549 family) n=1 Tax=Catenuloplanes nepalensis TaxID=587533 RepID=A0ABT9ML49_9ACTN|nr:HAD-IA family hydrolase [Catenuloplanes nepalensis]MDP9792144.1 HAD superfamily hydrolase (TIGR01549 family) [Catenuloplanes nepalensis]
MLIRPRALLLDFHGVIGRAEARPGREDAFIEVLARIAGPSVPADRVRADHAAGLAAYRSWRDAMSRPSAPPELTQQDFWGEYVAADWPAAARTAVRDSAEVLSRLWLIDNNDWTLLPGIVELVRTAVDAGLPVAVVSNTLCGAAFREIIAASPLDGAFGAEIYSDEVGVRKPNPAILKHAADRLGVDLTHAWFAGDKLDRDVLCGRRAGVGATILMSPEPVSHPSITPHTNVADADALRTLLQAYLT